MKIDKNKIILVIESDPMYYGIYYYFKYGDKLSNKHISSTKEEVSYILIQEIEEILNDFIKHLESLPETKCILSELFEKFCISLIENDFQKILCSFNKRKTFIDNFLKNKII